jgi:hypothetical protein
MVVLLLPVTVHALEIGQVLAWQLNPAAGGRRPPGARADDRVAQAGDGGGFAGVDRGGHVTGGGPAAGAPRASGGDVDAGHCGERAGLGPPFLQGLVTGGQRGGTAVTGAAACRVHGGGGVQHLPQFCMPVPGRLP